VGGFLLVIEQRDDVATKDDEPGGMILDAHVDDLDAAEAQLREAGVDRAMPPEARLRWFGTFADPDGNHLQSTQFR